MSLDRSNIQLRRAAIVLVASAATVAPIAAAPAAHAKSRASVGIPGFSFSPQTLVVHPGTRVTWTNTHAHVPHNVTTKAGSRVGFASPQFMWAAGSGPGGPSSFTVKLTKKGTYNYECTLHQGMTGKVIVR